MTTKIKNILFDFDGTLVDSAPGIVKTMEQTFIRMGIAIPSEAERRATIGLPLQKALQLLGNLNDEDAAKATDIYHELFPIYEANYVKVFPLVTETLIALKDQNIRMAIATSRDRVSYELIADKRGLSKMFENVVTGADGITPKPAPDMVLTLLKRMNITEKETLVVGDTTFDIKMGNAAHCRTCAVTYGNHDKQTLRQAQPTYVIHSFNDLTKIISGGYE